MREEDILTEKEELENKIEDSESSVKTYQRIIIKIAVFLLVLWILFFQIIGITVCPTNDMYPRMDYGDLVLYYRLDKDVSAQDVIVVEKELPDTGKATTLVLRVVAKEGDTVEITDDARLIINGNAVQESNIFAETTKYEGYTEYPLTLGEGQCFVLADNRDGGNDSRYFGAVDEDEILGTVITILRRNMF